MNKIYCCLRTLLFYSGNGHRTVLIVRAKREWRLQVRTQRFSEFVLAVNPRDSSFVAIEFDCDWTETKRRNKLREASETVNLTNIMQQHGLALRIRS
jgi:hypothetical protein